MWSFDRQIRDYIVLELQNKIVFFATQPIAHPSGGQCSRLKSSMPFKHNFALQIKLIPLPKQPFKMQPQIENEDITWSPQYNLHVTRTNKRRALSLQVVKLDGWFLTLHIVLETCTMYFMHKFNMSFVFHLYILRLTSWIWTNPSIEEFKFESPSKWNSCEGLLLEHWWRVLPTTLLRSLPTHMIFHPQPIVYSHEDIWLITDNYTKYDI